MEIQTEKIAFRSDELVACTRCNKNNPPDRTSCMYCGEAIETPVGYDGPLKLNLRPIEKWENGFNLVLVPPAAGADAEAAARLLKWEPEAIEKMMAASFPFPMARLALETEAETAAERLRRAGIKAAVVSDIDLKIGKPNVRLRSLRFLESGLEAVSFNTGETRMIGYDSLALIVVGRIVESKTESVEKRNKDERKVLAETESASDEIVIDIYESGPGPGWRITAKGFDFSPLGDEKSLLASANIRVLLEKLKALCPNAKYVDEYSGLMNALSSVWELDRRKDFEGLKRTGPWKAGFSSVVHTSNVEQFGKYSRLQRLML